MDCVLGALFGAGVIPPGTVAVGDRNVGLLHVRKHFLVEFLAQAGQRLHHGLGVGVFGGQVCGDFRILLVAKPGVVVGEDNAVQEGLLVTVMGTLSLHDALPI